MTTLLVKPGNPVKVTSGVKFEAGFGWDSPDEDNPVDLDLAVVRRLGPDFSEACCWTNEDWYHPELGTTSAGQPHIASPERDLHHTGDDRTGKESKTGYDETCFVDPGLAPKATTQYVFIVTDWVNPQDRDPKNPPVLAAATNIKFGIKQVGTNNELVVPLDSQNPFDMTAIVATLDFMPDGTQHLNAVPADKSGTSDDLIAVLRKLKCKL